MSADRLSPAAAASAGGAPPDMSAAVRNAGIQAHRPSSSQLWKVYPHTESIPLRLASTAGIDASTVCPSGRGWTVLGVARVATSAISQDASGISATTPSAARQPAKLTTKPDTPSASA